MSTARKLRRGTTSAHGSFTGLEAEITVDTDLKTLVVHDGETPGGFPLAKGYRTGFKNYIVNGGFNIWQRGTVAVLGDYVYKSVDRWYQVHCTIEKAVDLVGEPFAKCTCTDIGSTNYIGHNIENGRQFSNKTLTVSFEIDSPDGLTDGLIKVHTKDNGGNDLTLLYTNFQYTSIRTRYSFTFDVDNTLLKDDYLARVYIYGDRTSTNQNGKVFNVYKVQLEEGSISTPFEQRPIALELGLCQRYYYASPLSIEKQGTFFNDTAMDADYEMPVTMRVPPTITIYDAEGTAGTCSIYQGSWAHGNTCTTNRVRENMFNARATDLTDKTAWTSAQMEIHFTADAEL